MHKVYTDQWVNAQQQHKLYPDSFEAPDRTDLDGLCVGDIVKICNGYERFWTIIQSIQDDDVIARVDNVLVTSKTYNHGNLVRFRKEHIYCIHQ